MNVDLKSLAKNSHLITLPSTLWGFHIDPLCNFIAILYLDPLNINQLLMSKGVLLTNENNYLKATIYFCNKVVDIPGINLNITTLSEISILLFTIDEIKFCLHANDLKYGKCLKYINNSNINLCYNCMIEGRPFDIKKETEENCINSRNNYFEEFEKIPHVSTHNNSNLIVEKINENNVKSFECKTCGKIFAKKYNLNVHLRIHSGERPYICSKCGKTFTSRSNLSTHMMSVHCLKKRHACEFCDMTFVHPRVLKIHMRIHTGERPFMCQICGKVFSKNIHLTVHTRTHTGEKPHICNVCGKGFTTTGNLNSHKRVNHKEIIK